MARARYLLPALLALLSLSLPSAAASKRFDLVRLPERDGPVVKWKSPAGTLALGLPARVTWAVATRSMSPGLPYGECTGLRPLEELLEHHRLGHAEFLREVQAGLELWEKAANIRFSRIDDQEKADFVLGLSAEDDPSLHARVSLGFDERLLGQKPALAPLTKAVICLDRDELWTFSARHEVRGDDKHLSLRLLIAHEAGHVLGLDHAEDEAELMHHGVNERTSGLGAGDIEGARVLYGSSAR